MLTEQGFHPRMGYEDGRKKGGKKKGPNYQHVLNRHYKH